MNCMYLLFQLNELEYAVWTAFIFIVTRYSAYPSPTRLSYISENSLFSFTSTFLDRQNCDTYDILVNTFFRNYWLL